MKTPREYQQKAFDRFVETTAFCLNFACGLGKTFVLAWIARIRDKPTIIIAPLRLCQQWREELIDEGIPEADIFVASKPEESKNKQAYQAKFMAWLTK